MATQEDLQILSQAFQKAKADGDMEAANRFASALVSAHNPQKILTEGAQAPSPGLQVTDVEQLQGEPGFIETELGKSAGGLVGGLKGAIETTRATSALPIPPIARGALIAGGSALGAATGGATGELAQQAFQVATDSELSPENVRESVIRAAEAGGEEAVFDLLGNAIFKTGSAVYRGVIRPMARESAGLIKEILEKGGSNATLGQLTDNAMVRGIERLTRGAILGGSKFEKLDLAQDAAVASYSKEYAETYTGQALENLTPEATGKFFVNVIEEGKSAHKAAAGELYSKLDDFVKDIPVDRLDVVRTTLPGTSVAGGGFTRQTVRTAETVLAVDISSVSRKADKLIADLNKIGNVGATEEGSKLLNQLSSLKDGGGRMSFKEAHDLRSNLIAIKNNVSFKNTDSVANKNIATALQQVDNAMETAGKALDPEGLKQYRHISKFWKFGKKNFDNDLIRSLLKQEDAPEKIGAALFRPGSVSLARAARKAVKAAAAVTAKGDVPINFSTTWRRIQGGFLERMLPSSADDVSSAAFLKLHGNRQLQETLRATFTKEQQQSLNKLSKAMSELIEARGAKGGIAARQLASTAQVTAGIVGASGGVALGPAMMFVAMPEVFAQIATNPSLTGLFVSWTKSKPGTTAYRTAALKLATATGLSINDLLAPDELNTAKAADKSATDRAIRGLKSL